MNFAVEISEQAITDLQAIFEYIAFELRSPQNAIAQLSRIEQRIYSLTEMPERYRRYEKEPWQSRNVRIMPVDNYSVFYFPDHEKSIVYVVRVMYGGRNMEKELMEHHSK